MLVVSLVVVRQARANDGELYAQCAMLAAVICWGASIAALIASTRHSSDSQAFNAMMISILIRTGVPFGAGVLLTANSENFREGGLFGYLVLFYLVTLVVETLLSLRFLGRSYEPASKVS